MKLTSTAFGVQPTKPEPEYPCLMHSALSGCVVLFESYGNGTVLVPGSTSLPIGRHSTGWSMYGMKPFYGHVNVASAE